VFDFPADDSVSTTIIEASQPDQESRAVATRQPLIPPLDAIEPDEQ
jgi:hypothetical protein